MKQRWLSLMLAFGVLALAPLAKASEWDKRTVVTFGSPVEIPGKVLPAGTYVMRLADNTGNRTVVQFYNQDETALIATVLAVPDYREEPRGDTVITFDERRADSPQALRSWFYPGDTFGLQFVYEQNGPGFSR